MKAKSNLNNAPVLAPGKTECTIGDVVLRVDQTIEYIGCADIKTSIGKIKSFKYAGYGEEDISSVWMLVHEMSRVDQSEYVSVSNWYASYKLGLFKKNTSEHATDKKPKSTAKRPF